MLDGAKGFWVLCYAPRTKEHIVIMQADYKHWSSYLPAHYEFIAEGARSEMESIRKVIKGSTC